MSIFWLTIFAASLALVWYTYVGYAALVYVLSPCASEAPLPRLAMMTRFRACRS